MNETVAVAGRRCRAKNGDGTPCDQDGPFIVVLLFYPSELHGPSKPIGLSVSHFLCAAHAKDVRVRDVVVDGHYEMAEKICANNRWPWPDRNRTRLQIIPYAGSQLQKQDAREAASSN